MVTPRSVSRISLDDELRRQFKKLREGVVLDVGSGYSPYEKYIPKTKYLRLDIEPKYKPDICCDLNEVGLKSGHFDTIIAIEVLEHICEPQRAINEIYRILRPNGICILSTRFIHAYHPEPRDYYRFSRDSLKYLFRKFSRIEIYNHGNEIQVIWLIISRKIGTFLNIFNPLFAKIRFEKTNFPCGFVVLAQK